MLPNGNSEFIPIESVSQSVVNPILEEKELRIENILSNSTFRLSTSPKTSFDSARHFFLAIPIVRRVGSTQIDATPFVGGVNL
jgi:hypothetical protein